MAEDDFCYLTTIGRRTGTPHEIEIWYATDTADGGTDDAGTTIFLLAGGGRGSDWVRNAAAEPRVSVRFGSSTVSRSATARLLDADDADAGEVERARDLVFEKYQARYGGDLTDWRERALPVALDLDTGLDAAEVTRTS